MACGRRHGRVWGGLGYVAEETTKASVLFTLARWNSYGPGLWHGGAAPMLDMISLYDTYLRRGTQALMNHVAVRSSPLAYATEAS